jgi:hypothetical protein
LGEEELCAGLLGQRLFGDYAEDYLLAIVGAAINWASLSNRDRTALLSAFIRSGPVPQAFKDYVWAQLGPELFHLVWQAATDLALLHPDTRGSWLWNYYLDVVDEEEKKHAILRLKAAWIAPLLAEGPNMYAINWLGLNWHCEECTAIALAKLPAERRAFIEEYAKVDRAIAEEDAFERLEARCAGY